MATTCVNSRTLRLHLLDVGGGGGGQGGLREGLTFADAEHDVISQMRLVYENVVAGFRQKVEARLFAFRLDRLAALPPVVRALGGASSETRFKLKAPLYVDSTSTIRFSNQTLKPEGAFKPGSSLHHRPTGLIQSVAPYTHVVGVEVDISETTTLKGMYVQQVDNQVLSTQGQPDVNLHRHTTSPAS